MAARTLSIGMTKLLDSLVQVAKTYGADCLSPAQMDHFVAALAEKVTADLKMTAGINPDREYSLSEIGEYGFGPKKGRFYKAYKHIIRKDGRRSYVLGRDLLALREGAPTLATSPAPFQPTMRRPRGRPRKIVPGNAHGAATLEAVASQLTRHSELEPAM